LIQYYWIKERLSPTGDSLSFLPVSSPVSKFSEFKNKAEFPSPHFSAIIVYHVYSGSYPVSKTCSDPKTSAMFSYASTPELKMKKWFI
jgi:hypothetical protein